MFNFFVKVGEEGLDRYQNFDIYVECDLSETWKGLQRGGGAKVHTYPCHWASRALMAGAREGGGSGISGEGGGLAVRRGCVWRYCVGGSWGVRCFGDDKLSNLGQECPHDCCNLCRRIIFFVRHINAQHET
jgi:hypothetical protein